MKILSVIGSLAHGGAETVLVDLVTGLARHEHAVLHFSRANGIAADPAFAQRLARAGLCVDADWRCLASAARVQAALGGFVPEVVLVHWWGQDPWRHWITECASEPHGRCPTFVAVLHHAGIAPVAMYDHYVLVSESQRRQVADRPPARVRVIPNGVDLARFPTPARPPAARGSVVIGRVSGLRPGKIPADWIHTAASFGLPGARFVIAGDGPLRPGLLAEVRRLGLDAQFTLPGHVPRDRVPSLLGTFDIFCHVTSTAIECHPLALLEALAAGVPLVAEARGGIPEIVRDGDNGLLAHSAAEVGRHLRALASDEGLRLRLADGARRSAARFALRRQIEAYERLLEEVSAARCALDPTPWATMAPARDDREPPVG